MVCYSVIYLSSYYGAKHVRSDGLSILAEFLSVHSALWNNVTKSMHEIILQHLEHNLKSIGNHDDSMYRLSIAKHYGFCCGIFKQDKS